MEFTNLILILVVGLMGFTLGFLSGGIMGIHGVEQENKEKSIDKESKDPNKRQYIPIRP